LEIFEDLGLVEQAINAGVWLTGITVFNDGKPARTMKVPAAGFPYGALSLAQFGIYRQLSEGVGLACGFARPAQSCDWK
jgi:hypothetical protein